ncbi:chaperone protein YajL [Clostridium acetireducens DSM 10703]|jgi:4-methyl-5(b-hydroxyethyl)-thiazole monophosphate biosynthesis|uniref:Chaperone protein YajL n=1 Tax=Clostridium acetireducens DSM 10703 TaxID=1121290 RepID=A0A1E8EY60_9CLOT|nr:DJ-1 family glyoxalase III [Clostridium acetireducens]OFI05894.1 chaperone protein YajL [Clostridium acetireducens DSM 10703]
MKKAVVLFAEGFEEIEGLTVVDVLRRAGVLCDMCSVSSNKEVVGAHNIPIKTDITFDNANFDEYEAIIMPGGIPGSTNLRDNNKVLDKVRDFNNKGKIVAAMCAAPIVLVAAGVVAERTITAYPGIEKELGNVNYSEEIVVQDGNIITSRGPATAIYFALKILQNLSGREVAENIKEGMLVNLIEK